MRLIVSIILVAVVAGCKTRDDEAKVKDDKPAGKAQQITLNEKDSQFVKSLIKSGSFISTGFDIALYYRSGPEMPQPSVGLIGTKEDNTESVFPVVFVSYVKEIETIVKRIAPPVILTADKGAQITQWSAFVSCNDSTCELRANMGTDIKVGVEESLRFSEEGMGLVPNSKIVCGYKVEVVGLDEQAVLNLAKNRMQPGAKNLVTIVLGDYDSKNDKLMNSNQVCPRAVLNGVCNMIVREGDEDSLICPIKEESFGYYRARFSQSRAVYSLKYKAWYLVPSGKLNTLTMVGPRDSYPGEQDYKATMRSFLNNYGESERP